MLSCVNLFSGLVCRLQNQPSLHHAEAHYCFCKSIITAHPWIAASQDKHSLHSCLTSECVSKRDSGISWGCSQFTSDCISFLNLYRLKYNSRFSEVCLSWTEIHWNPKKPSCTHIYIFFFRNMQRYNQPMCAVFCLSYKHDENWWNK